MSEYVLMPGAVGVGSIHSAGILYLGEAAAVAVAVAVGCGAAAVVEQPVNAATLTAATAAALKMNFMTVMASLRASG
jgi:hypothetical protein